MRTILEWIGAFAILALETLILLGLFAVGLVVLVVVPR